MAGICPCTLGNSVAGALFNLQNVKKLNQQDQELEQTAVATVISRRVDTLYSLNRSDSSWVYLVKFRLENGETPELKVSEENYRDFTPDRVFRLAWKGDTLMAFDEVESK